MKTLQLRKDGRLVQPIDLADIDEERADKLFERRARADQHKRLVKKFERKQRARFETLAAPIARNATAYFLADADPFYASLRQTFEIQDARATELRKLLKHKGTWARQHKACVWSNARVVTLHGTAEVLPSNGTYQIKQGNSTRVLFDVRRVANLLGGKYERSDLANHHTCSR